MIFVSIIVGIREEFISAINANHSEFGLKLSIDAVERLADYFQIVQANNALLHLVAPCSPEEFAIRHVLESLTLLEFLHTGTRFADVGTGAGLPSIPCLLVRNDLSALLIESKERKAAYLEAAVNKLGIGERAKVYSRQFAEVDLGNASAVTSRALDRFSERMPRLIKWANKRRIILFGGNNIRETLEAKNVKFTENRIPKSEQRFIFCI